MAQILQLRILEILDKKAIQNGGIADSTDEEIAKQINDATLNEVRYEIKNLRDLNEITCEVAGEHLLFIGITGTGSKRVERELDKETGKKIIQTTTPHPPYIPPGAFGGPSVDRSDREEFGFGEPIYVEGPKRNALGSFVRNHKGTVKVIIIGLAISGSFFVLNHIFPPSVQNEPPKEPFSANVTVGIDQPITINLALNGEPDTKVNIAIKGVVPDPGVITLRLDNYTLNPHQYNTSEITIDRLYLQKNEQVPVTPNQPIQQLVTVILTPSARYSPNYVLKDPKIINEWYIGTITFSADYYDQVTKTTKSYPVTSKLKIRMLGLPIGY